VIFMCVTCLDHVCDVTYAGDMTHSCVDVTHDVCDMTRSCVCHYSFMCVT